jgi:hypothetical protein
MKVIAINDAPMPKNGYFSNGVYMDRAYYKGDIFELYETFNDYYVVWHDKLGAEMEVDSNNFLTLEEWREKQIDKIL